MGFLYFGNILYITEVIGSFSFFLSDLYNLHHYDKKRTENGEDGKGELNEILSDMLPGSGFSPMQLSFP